MSSAADGREDLFSVAGLRALNWAAPSLLSLNVNKHADCSALVSGCNRSRLLSLP